MMSRSFPKDTKESSERFEAILFGYPGEQVDQSTLLGNDDLKGFSEVGSMKGYSILDTRSRSF